MELDEVKRLIETGLPGCEALVTGDGCNLEATVISDVFAGKLPLQKQRLVMATVKAQIESNEIHALSFKTYTPEEWQVMKPALSRNA